MNLLEFENERFPGTWDKETIKELEEYKSPKKEYSEMFPNVDRSNEGWETKQDEYYCWQGTRIPQWFE